VDELTYLRASTLPLERIVEAFNRSFEGYFVPMTHTADSLRSLVMINDVSLAHSFVAVDADDRPAGVVLVAIRGSCGWIGGMGLAPAWRGRGQAGPLMQVAITEARTLGLAAVELEVLAQNTPARRLYTRLGFENVRSLAVFTGPLVNDTALVDTRLPLRSISVARALADFAALHQVPSAWQRDLPALLRMAPTLSAAALLESQTVRASLIYMSSALGYSIMDFGSRAATPDARRDDAIALIQALVSPMPDAPVRAINVPPGDALGDALTALGCPTPHMQWEMKLQLLDADGSSRA
jgi:ribosomal protein S18 acetylase RimI-like enzyme